MTDAELTEFATDFREGILDGHPSRWMCFAVCAPMQGLLRIYGVNTEMIETDLGASNHFWLRLPDGRALDPTADQFNELQVEQLPPVYLGQPCLIHTTS